MSIQSGLTCNFILDSNGLSIGVAFQSDNGGMNYGGAITIQTPAKTGPIVTKLWDSDGNVFFTVYLTDKGPSGPNCVINSASEPGTYTPYIQVWSQSGLQCKIIPNGGGNGVYDYTLEIAISSDNDFTAKELVK